MPHAASLSLTGGTDAIAMEPHLPDTPARLPTSLHWVAWGLVAAALLRAGLIAVASQQQLALLPWSGVSAAVIVWTVIGVVVKTSVRLPSHDRSAWLCLAGAIGIGASNVSQQVMLAAAQVTLAPVAQLASAGIASILCIATLAVNTDRHEPLASRVLQAALDVVAVLGAVALISVLLTSLVFPFGTSIAIALPDISAIVLDLTLILVVVLLSSSSPRTLRVIQGFLWAMIGLRLLSLFGLPTIPAGSTLEVCETLRATLSAPAVLRWVEHRSVGIQPDFPLAGADAPIPQVAVWLALAHAILARDLAPAPVLTLLGVEVVRVTVQAIRRQHQRHRWWQAIQRERQAHFAEQAAAQERLTALARLVHDQAAPLSGLDRIYREIERAGINEVARRIGGHLGILLSLASQLRASLTQRTPSPRAPVAVAVLPIVRATVDAVGERAELAEIDLFCALNSAGATVLGDAVALRRVLDNLVANALDATGEGGQVGVELWDDRHHPGWLTITVRDTGTGLREAVPGSEAFLKQAKPAGRGMGLGLSIVRELTEQMGGECGATSTPGKGSTFWIRLRYVEQRPEPPATGMEMSTS